MLEDTEMERGDDRSARPRQQRCENPLCRYYGRGWIVHPRHVADGLITWDTVQCSSCGSVPAIVPEPAIHRITVESPPIEVDASDGDSLFPPGKHIFRSPRDLREWAAERLGVPVETVVLDLVATVNA